MADLLRCVDRWGREIRLTEERWHGHIILHHPDLTRYVAAVRQTLVDLARIIHGGGW